ncbi:MAG: histidine kinase, partial [Actinomycetota bacterium]|nr:histidine kinase [Actinomycetota bacterium]
RLAQRARSDLLVVHVESGEDRDPPGWADTMRKLVEELGGEFEVLRGDDPIETVLSFAYRQHVTQIIVGESLRSRVKELFRRSFVNELIRKASNVDIHVIARAR